MDAKYSNALTAGPALRKMLAASPLIAEKVGDRIFPVISSEDEQPPFIAYRRVMVDETTVADGPSPRMAVYEFQVYAKAWEEGLQIAAATVAALADSRPEAPIRRCILQNATETYTDVNQCYVQILDFKVKTIN